MNNDKSMIVYKEGVIIKIRKFFKKLFSTRKKEDISEEWLYKTEEADKIPDNQNNKQFLEEIIIYDKKVLNMAEKNKFLEEINGNSEALNMLSIERLKKLVQYYDEIIKQNDKNIKKLKESA